MVCTFFGHRDVSNIIKQPLKKILIDLIENKNVDLFYVGNQGDFDKMVKQTLEELCLIYRSISYHEVLAYIPGKRKEFDNKDYSKTIYPSILENKPTKYAIIERNKWMIEKSQYVVTYVRYSGGAGKFKEIAEKKGRTVINIADFV